MEEQQKSIVNYKQQQHELWCSRYNNNQSSFKETYYIPVIYSLFSELIRYGKTTKYTKKEMNYMLHEIYKINNEITELEYYGSAGESIISSAITIASKRFFWNITDDLIDEMNESFDDDNIYNVLVKYKRQKQLELITKLKNDGKLFLNE